VQILSQPPYQIASGQGQKRPAISIKPALPGTENDPGLESQASQPFSLQTAALPPVFHTCLMAIIQYLCGCGRAHISQGHSMHRSAFYLPWDPAHKLCKQGEKRYMKALGLHCTFAQPGRQYSRPALGSPDLTCNHAFNSREGSCRYYLLICEAGSACLGLMGLHVEAFEVEENVSCKTRNRTGTIQTEDPERTMRWTACLVYVKLGCKTKRR